MLQGEEQGGVDEGGRESGVGIESIFLFNTLVCERESECVKVWARAKARDRDRDRACVYA